MSFSVLLNQYTRLIKKLKENGKNELVTQSYFLAQSFREQELNY